MFCTPLKSLGLSRPLAVVLLLAFCLAESLARYHICCFPLYRCGTTSTWTPRGFSQVLRDNASTEQGGGGYTNFNVAFSTYDTQLLEGSKSFINVVLMSLKHLCLSFHLALSHLVYSSMKTWPLAEAGQRWTWSLSGEQKGEIAQIVMLCGVKNDAHPPPGV